MTEAEIKRARRIETLKKKAESLGYKPYIHPGKEFDGVYVSNDGYFYSIKSGCSLVRLNRSAKAATGTLYSHIGRRVNIATAVATLFVPNPNQYRDFRYKDGDRSNCAASNLEWVERSAFYCSTNLTPEDVETIEKARGFDRRNELAERFDIPEWIITEIWRNARRKDRIASSVQDCREQAGYLRRRPLRRRTYRARIKAKPPVGVPTRAIG